MARVRRTLRITQPARDTQIDDQFWPLVVALALLGGLIAGSVLAYLRLDEPRWYANAWTWLIAIPLVISAALLALAWTGNRMLRRTMQLAIVLGVLVHVVLLIVALQTDVFYRAWVEVLATASKPPDKKSTAVPDYLSWQHDPQRRVARDVQQPVEVQPPDPEPDRDRVRPEPVPPVPPRAEMQPRPVPEPQDVPRPNIVKHAEPNQSMPRERDEMSQLSRKVAATPPRSTQAASVADTVVRPERRDERAQPRPDDVGVRAQEKQEQRLTDVARTSVQSPEPAPSRQWSRRERESQPVAQEPPANAVARRDQRPSVAPRAEADERGRPAAPRRSELDELQPHNTAARKQETRTPETREEIDTPPRERVTPAVIARRDLQQPAPVRDELAQTPRPAFNRQPRVTERPDVAPLTDSSAPAATAANTAAQPLDVRVAAAPNRPPAEAAELGPLPQRVSSPAKEATAADPARARAGPLASSDAANPIAAAGNRENPQRQLSVDTPGAAAAHQVAARQSRRRSLPIDPSLNAVPEPQVPRRRAERESAEAQSPTTAESPTRTADVARQTAAAAAAATMALSKSDLGAAGRGVSQNLGHAEPLGDSPATVASGAAQRAAAQQRFAEGPALTPQDAAMVRQARAGQLRPNAVLHATPLNPSSIAGSRQSAELNATASAAVTRAAANADRGDVTAAKGTLDVDTGPTTLVAESGAGRAGGGGQPELSEGSVREPLLRASRDSAPLPALLADQRSAVVSAPAGVGGASAPPSDLDANADSLVNARQAPAPAAPGGPAAVAGGDNSVASLSLTPAARRASDAADQASRHDVGEGPARVARKAAQDRQLALDAGVLDLSAGNAADDSDEHVPSPSMHVDAASTSPSEKQALAGAVSDERRPQSEAAEGDGPADAPRVDGLAARAEAVDASIGPPTAGGGTDAPPRAARGPEMVAQVRADEVEVAGSPRSSGEADARPRNTQGLTAADRATGSEARHSDFPARSSRAAEANESEARHSDLAADQAADSVYGSSQVKIARASPADGPAALSDSTAGGPGKRTPRIQLSDSLAGIATQAAMPVATVNAQPNADEGLLPGDPSVGPLSRQAGPALAVEIEAPAGVGGLDADITVDVGLKTRPMSESTTQIQLETTRFTRNRVGGQPDFNTAAAMPTESFRRRVARTEGSGVPADAAGPQTEEAIELGLVFLSQAQLPDGRWTLDRFAREDGLPQLASDSAATGLALLAFQGAGYTHRDFRYADVVQRGIEFLLRNQQSDGSLFIPMDDESNRVVQFYSHSIAALALCEAYGMTQDSTLREPAQRAIDFIVATQNAQRGGWRYTTGVSSDTSVTGWMMMALKSGELANLEVPAETYRHIRRWLDSAQASKAQPHLYCYNPFAPQDSAEQRAGRKPTPTMTSVGLLMRLYFGWRRDNPAMARGAQYLAQLPPAIGTSTNPQRDTYYWYYATQVMFHMGGDYWREWNRQLHPVLVGAQLREGPMAGSWDPRNPVPDRWGPFAGRLYVTTMNLLSLEVTYRHLPLYEDTAK